MGSDWLVEAGRLALRNSTALTPVAKCRKTDTQPLQLGVGSPVWEAKLPSWWPGPHGCPALQRQWAPFAIWGHCFLGQDSWFQARVVTRARAQLCLRGLAQIRMHFPSPGDISCPLGLEEQGLDFIPWWPFQTGHSQGSRLPFTLNSCVAKGTPSLVRMWLCPESGHLLGGAWKCVRDGKKSELSSDRTALQSPVLAPFIHIAGDGMEPQLWVCTLWLTRPPCG